jgi:signal transduction histidine kinase
MTFLIFYVALQWSEDRVGERRILIDRDHAVERFVSGEQGKIVIDALTVAYNDMSLLPKEYQAYLSETDYYLGEVGDLIDPMSHMVYKGEYFDKGQTKSVVLLSMIDSVEFDTDEMAYAGVIVIAFMAVLMFSFGTLLYRLSKRLIEPLNGIASQLEQQSGDANIEFTISDEAADEFQSLTNRLNQYRSDLNLALKREQAFARYASHELRTPLTVVKGANKLLLRSEYNEFQSRQMIRIDDATNEMITMVDALLSIVRYERSVDDAPFRNIDKPEVEAVIASNSLQAGDKNIQVNLEHQYSPSVRATPAVMNMVLGNLIRNAIAASDLGNIDIYVDQHKIEIIDDGPGLSDSPSEDGHGLGLLIVDDLCRRYHWRFELLNHPDRGCIASIYF